MTTKLLLTFDVELVWRHHVAGLNWEANYARSIEPAGVGLGYQLARLAEFGLKGVFFIDPMPAVLFGLDPVKRMVDTVLEAGQEIQLHIHPIWRRVLRHGVSGIINGFDLNEYDAAEQKALIADALALIVEAGAPPPIAFRAGSYAVDDTTLEILGQFGLRYDSSHNGCEAPCPSALSLPNDAMAPVEHRGIVEIPISQVRQPGGSLRHLQIGAVSLQEIKLAIDHAVTHRHLTMTLVSHSFELVRRDGLRAKPIVVARFDGLCRMLQKRVGEVSTAHFADLGQLPLDTDARPATLSPATMVRRMGIQLWSNLTEERRT